MNMPYRHISCWVLLITATLTLASWNQEPRDSDRLTMALEYFQSGKYHEALLLFEKLDKEYALNPRYHAYMGVCYYYEWLYEEACRYLDEAIPKLEAFAPHERSVYYYTDGESHFQLQQYREAIPFFEKALTVCYENEKGDILYRLGLCHMFAEEWQEAHDHYKLALDNYLTYRDTPDMQARIYQTAHMMKGCEAHLPKTEEKEDPEKQEKAITPQSPENPDNPESPENPENPDNPENPESPEIPVIPENPSNPSNPLNPLNPPIPTMATKAIKDTIRSAIPNTVNIQEIYEQKVEIKE